MLAAAVGMGFWSNSLCIGDRQKVSLPVKLKLARCLLFALFFSEHCLLVRWCSETQSTTWSWGHMVGVHGTIWHSVSLGATWSWRPQVQQPYMKVPWSSQKQSGQNTTVRAEIMTELILKRAGPVIFKTFLLELIAFRPIPVICPARGVKPENYWKR